MFFFTYSVGRPNLVNVCTLPVYLIGARNGRSRGAGPAPRRTSYPINVFLKTKKPGVATPGLPVPKRQA